MSELNEIKQEIKYLLNSHHILIKSLQDNNKGLMEMNILLRGLISLLAEVKVNQNNE